MNKPIIAHILHIPGDNSSVVHVWENSLVSGQLSELQAYYHVSEHSLSPNTKDNCGQNNYTDLYFLSLTKLTVLVRSQVRGSQSLQGTLEYRQEDTMPSPSSVVLDNFYIDDSMKNDVAQYVEKAPTNAFPLTIKRLNCNLT